MFPGAAALNALFQARTVAVGGWLMASSKASTETMGGGVFLFSHSSPPLKLKPVVGG